MNAGAKWIVVDDVNTQTIHLEFQFAVEQCK